MIHLSNNILAAIRENKRQALTALTITISLLLTPFCWGTATSNNDNNDYNEQSIFKLTELKES